MKASDRKFHILYKTTCLITGRFYIGIHSTDKIEDGYLGSGKRLVSSVKKYGRFNHSREILEICATRDILIVREAEIVSNDLLLDALCMNLIKGGYANNREFGCTEKSRALMSAASKAAVRTPEWYEKAVATRRANDSYGHTPETLEKIRKAKSGTVLSEEHKQKISRANTGKKRSEETCMNISIAVTGKNLGKKFGPRTEGQKEHLRKCNLGKTQSQESKEKMRAAKQRRRDSGIKLGHGHKPCTIDGVEIFASVKELVQKHGNGKKGARHPDFRFVEKEQV